MILVRAALGDPATRTRFGGNHSPTLFQQFGGQFPDQILELGITGEAKVFHDPFPDLSAQMNITLHFS